MKTKKILILFILAIFILIGSVLSYFYFLSQPKYSTNITELYSSFTDYMKETVDYRLQLLDCTPEKYYYDNSNLCFICGNIHPCFGFGWVERSGGRKMNPKSLFFLKGKYSKEDTLNFYSYGIAKLLNCRCNEECICDDEIKTEMTENEIRFTFPTDTNIKEKIEKIIKEECSVTGENLLLFRCKNLKGIILTESNTLIFRYSQ